jgi:cysteine desulfurase/selenocysteine lyase
MVRRDFPALHQEVNGKPLVYLDSAATSQKPQSVLNVQNAYYLRDNANVHRGIHELSRRATEAYEEARWKVARWIGAEEAAEVIWTRGTTEAINLVAHAWGMDNVSSGDEILLTTMEHHSNLVPWQLLSRRTGVRLRYVELDDQGRLILDDLDSILSERTRLVAVSHVSNALGTINPVRTIAEAARRVGALVLVDGAQGVVHTDVDVQSLGADFYAFSGHKMCAPTGIGALWARREVLESMEPYQGGGEMIHTVERDMSTWAELPHKFEAGTPNIAGAAVDYLAGIGMDRVMEHERVLTAYAIEHLASVPGIRIFGPDSLEERSAVISFTLGDAHPHDCAQLVMSHFGISATARASLYIYNTTDDIDRLVDGLQSVRAIFG